MSSLLLHTTHEITLSMFLSKQSCNEDVIKSYQTYRSEIRNIVVKLKTFYLNTIV